MKKIAFLFCLVVMVLSCGSNGVAEDTEDLDKLYLIPPTLYADFQEGNIKFYFPVGIPFPYKTKVRIKFRGSYKSGQESIFITVEEGNAVEIPKGSFSSCVAQTLCDYCQDGIYLVSSQSVPLYFIK